MDFSVTLDQFSGPLDKLLELIEAKELDVTRVSLAAVTDDFLEYLKKKGGEIEPALLADFLVIAARLVLIKSKALIPDLTLTDEEEHEIVDLETRLAVYQTFAARNGPASVELNKLWDRHQTLYARPFLMAVGEGGIFYPGANLSLAAVTDVMNRISNELKELTQEPSALKIAIVSLEEKIGELLERCKNAVVSSFRSMTTKRSRPEVVAMFLAVLHLLKGRTIHVEQQEHFGDIIVRKLDNGPKDER